MYKKIAEQSERFSKLLTRKYVLVFFLIFTGYFLIGRSAFLFDSVSGFTSLVWAPTGISIVILYLFGLRFSPAILLGAILINLSIGASLFVSLGIALSITLEAFIAVHVLRMFAFDPSLSRTRDVLILVVPAIFFSTLAGSLVGIITLHLGGVIEADIYFSTWIAWWVRDMMGALVFTPMVMVWFAPIKEVIKTIISLIKKVEVVAVFSFLIFINFVIFFSISGEFWTNSSFPYLIFVPLIWIALRMGQRGSVTAIFATSVIAIYSTATGSGPFVEDTLHQSFITLNIFMGTVSLTMMILSTTVLERSVALETLKLEDKKLAQERARLDAVFLSIGEGLVVTDKDGRITMVNRAFEDMLGWSREEAIGKIFVDMVYTEEANGIQVLAEEKHLSRILSGAETNDEGVIRGHYFIRKDGSKFPVSIITNKINDIYLEGTVQVFRDITKEQEIDKAKTEFVSLASHQLRTPATNMKWFLEMLLTGEVGELNPKQKEYFEEVHKNNKRMIVLINTILNVSRIELGIFEVAPVKTDIPTLVKAVLGEYENHITERQLKVSELYADNLPKIVLDPKLVRIVLHNLLSNAIKYTPLKGRINLGVQIKNKGDNVSGQLIKKQSLVVSIEDSGYGIPSNQQDKIFTRLFRADNVRKKDTDGTGLGLYLAKMIVEHTKGLLWYQSTLNKGSTFYLSLPTEGMKQRSGIKELTVGSPEQTG